MYTSIILPLKRIVARAAYEVANVFGIHEGMSALCYHSISSSSYPYAVAFTECMKQLDKTRAHASFLCADDIMRVLDNKMKIFGPAVLLTIDDGYKDALSLVPYLQKYGIKPLLFVLSHPQRANRKELGNSGQLLSWSDIKKLRKYGWTIGCHSATHRDFSRLTDQEVAFEVKESKKILEKKLGMPVEFFAYPRGEYDDRIVRQVVSAGYKAAFGIDPGSVTSKSFRYLLPRTVINKTHTAHEFPVVYSPSTYALRSFLENIPFRRLINI